MQSIQIVPVTDSEQLKPCAALLASVYNSEPWNDGWTDEVALDKLLCFYNSPKFSGYMAYSGTELVGCYVGNIEPYFSGDYFYLKEMFVSVTAQRQGIGAELLKTLKADLHKQGIETVILFTSSQFFPFGFYQKNGFNTMEGMCMMHYGA